MTVPDRPSRVPVPPDAVVRWATIISAVASVIVLVTRVM
jgi:hypothetical protein